MNESSEGSLCLQCNSRIDAKTCQFSLKKYKFPLCEDCQIWFIGKVFSTTKETLDLYFALKKKGVGAQLASHDRYKKVDIAIQGSRVHIEVEGSPHHSGSQGVLLDLNKASRDLGNGYITIRISDALVKFHMDQTTDLLRRLAEENQTATGSRPS